MPSVKQMNEVFLVADAQGVVWTMDSKEKVESTKTDVLTFIDSASKYITRASKLRLLGLPQNSQLIAELYQTLGASTDKLEIGTPLYCRTLPATSPSDILETMSPKDSRPSNLKGLPACLGGWHRANHHDYSTCRLAQAVLYDTWSRAGLLESHPAFPAISFISGYSRVDAENLLVTIGDPRWYVDLSRPGRTAKLRSYLGLRTPVISALWQQDPEGLERFGAMIYRTWHLLDAWTGAMREAPRLPALDLPGNFVWRRFCEFEDPIRGSLRASAFFLTFLHEVWLDTMSSQELFVPEYFFTRAGNDVAAVDQNGTTAKAYVEHQRQYIKP